MLIINAIVLNILSGAMLFALARMYERRIFIPAENDAQRLEEHEQFNRKIVASAPVGICILRTADGTNILSNELAHNYLNMLTHEDRQRLTQIICGQQVNFVDVLTSNHTNLQISFVHSRYRNEKRRHLRAGGRFRPRENGGVAAGDGPGGGAGQPVEIDVPGDR